MYKATITDKQKKQFSWFNDTDGFLPFLTGFFICVIGVVGWTVMASMGLHLIGWFAMIPFILYVTYTVRTLRSLPEPYVSCCSYSWRYDDNANCISITKLWEELNPENRDITLPLVDWVYKHRHMNDTYGKPMFLEDCDKREHAIRTLLEEQKKIEYHRPEVDDSDVLAVLEYAEAMKHARETLYPEAPALPAPRKPQAVNRLDFRRLL